MKKNLKDYLHLYIGCKVRWGMPHRHTGIIELHGENLEKVINDNLYYKPILRPLSDMTEEEAIELYCITTPYRVKDWDKDPDKYDISYNKDYKLPKEHPHYGVVFSITVVDLRTPHDYMNINLHWDILRYNHEQDGEPTIKDRLWHQAEATRYLLSKQFDVFELVNEGFAVDAISP